VVFGDPLDSLAASVYMTIHLKVPPFRSTGKQAMENNNVRGIFS